LSAVSFPRNEAAILLRVAYCYWHVVHQQWVVCCEFVSSALKLIVIYRHTLDDTQMVNLKDLPVAEPS
jgi:hypothetical protein